ncbi:MAG: cupin domain-containing protein [Desulfomonilia bacterium]
MTSALFFTLEETKRDPALQTRGERKLLVTSVRADKEEEATEVVWSHATLSGKCPVQLTKGTESAVFTQLAKQTRHRHMMGTEIYLLLEGRMSIDVEGTEYRMKEGDMIVVNPGSFHEVKREGEFLCRVVTAISGGPQDKYKYQ